MKTGLCFKILPPILLLLFVVAANAATFTVTNTNDSGPGSLRQAILDANTATTADTIAFSIPGAGVKKIAPLSPLPNVSGSGTNSITIDGTTQPGWAVGNLLIELSGENLSGTGASGLKLSPLTSTSQSFVRGLIINRFENGIYLQDSENITIEGCYIGTDSTGTISLRNDNGIYKEPIAPLGTENITIGGNSAATRNVISGNGSGMYIFGGSSYFIKGNYVGTDATGNSPLPNTVGIVIVGLNSVIGGATTAERNVISGNLFDGIVLESSGNTVQNNYIGLGADGFSSVGNGGDGIKIANSVNLVTRGNHLITGNVIANQKFNGITLTPSFNNTFGNKISNNSIYKNSNAVSAFHGIDLDDDQTTNNDAGDADTGTNNLQNFPVLTSVVAGVSGTAIQGTLNSTPGTSFRIEFFANDSNRREGRTFLGFQNVTTDGAGNANINAISGTFTFFGQFVTATATRNVAPLDTSEFSLPLAVTVTSLTVTNTNDSGAGSLRQAIIDANANPDPNVIQFAIAPLDGNVKTINLLSPLPTITDKTAIDGLSQSGASCSSPKVELNGTSAGASGDGFVITADNVGIQGFVINRFPGDGIVTSNNKGTFRCNKIGTNSAGTADLGNGGSGILLQSAAHQNLIESNTLSGNTLSGLRVLLSNDNIIRNNLVGLSSDGLSALGNSNGGIVIQGGTRNIIGGVEANERNVVSANNLGGVILAGTTNNEVTGNYVGTDINGGATLGNTGAGIFLSTSANDNIIGGDAPNAANLIAGNTGAGIAADNGGTGNRFARNSIHDNGGLAIDLNNDGVTANDAGDADTGENSLQNFPVISSAEAFFGGLKVSGSINSTANTALRVEIFANPTCDGTNGEGRNFLGAIDVVTDGSGNVSFSQTLNATGVSVGDSVTATATRRTSPFDTSEFSACRTATALTINTLTVTNTNDSGSGSLRQAILTSNVTPDPDQITFNIAGSGVKTINLTSALPTIIRPVIIDGLSQPGATCAAPLIELNGLSAGSNQDGLHVSSVADIRGLIINRFNGDGIEFDGDDGNTLKCSWIGTDNTGLNPAGNGLQGIYFNRVSRNVIGGSGEGNVISANNTRNANSLFDAGIQLFLSTGNVLQGNIIGLDRNGLRGAMTDRQENGIVLINSDDNLIGGTTAAVRNVIGNTDFIGVKLENTDKCNIKGNYIGIEATGGAPAGPNFNGIGVYVSGTSVESVIGGTENGAGNVISNNSTGIEFFGSTVLNHKVQGNIVGLNPAGTARAGSQNEGIRVGFGSTVTIGGRTVSARNVVSGNGTGIVLSNNNQTTNMSNTIVEGNYVGLAADGTTVIAGQQTGISITEGTNGNRIGGTAAGSGNLISGNGNGIAISTKNNLVHGNLIGTDAGGSLDKGNSNGILLNTGAESNLIGGSTTTARNVISGNVNGVATAVGATSANSNTIQSNFIGTAQDGITALANSQDGIRLESSSNLILSNLIAFNNQKGVNIFTTGAGNRISANSIHTNGALGIDLGNNGVTPNDAGDADLANNQQNFPVLTSAALTTVNGTLNSTANTSFTIEFFLSPTADPTNHGEGTTFLGSIAVTTDGAGNAGFTFTSPVALPNGQFVAATATNNTTGDTSEFSQVRAAATPTAADVNIGGQIVTREGRAIPRAMLTLSGPNGMVKTAISNPFGYFRFTDLPAGETYVITVRDKTHVFTPDSFVVTLNDSVDSFLIIGRLPEDAEASKAESTPVGDS